MSQVKQIGDHDFDQEVINSESPVIVDFWAEWCGPCRAVAPIIDQLATDNTFVKFVKVDVDKHNVKAAEAGVRAIPSIILYNKGKEVKRVTGADINGIKSLISAASEDSKA